MAQDVYTAIMTRNARLARFTDENPNVATLLMKIVLHLESVSREWGKSVSGLDLDCHGSPDGRMVLVNVKKK